jgi:hypothetical protein
VDPKYLSGTPTPGGLVDTILKAGQATAAGAHSEGNYMWVQEPSGAGVYAHVHGRWAQATDQLATEIQQGQVQVHIHPDGTVHLHDVV